MKIRRGMRCLGCATAIALALLATACEADDDSTTGKPRSTSSSDSSVERSPEPTKRSKDRTSEPADDRGTESKPDEVTDTDQPKPDRARGKQYRVAEVVDGDTVHLAKRGQTSVRIIGIETPETVHPSQPVECGGPAASAAAEHLLTGRQVRLIPDPSQGRVDAYGRILGYIEITGVGDYGLQMIRRGHAAEYTYDAAYRNQSRYLAAQRRAQHAGKGLWKHCGGVDTPLEQPTAEPEAAAPTQGSDADCAPGYNPCVPPAPPDLDCADVDGPIRITGDDPHRFDADGDGIGCDA